MNNTTAKQVVGVQSLTSYDTMGLYSSPESFWRSYDVWGSGQGMRVMWMKNNDERRF